MTHMQISYLTDSKGKKAAVQIPFKEWSELITEYERLKQYYELKNNLLVSFREIAEIEKGDKTASTLSEFLNER
jgi:hypothetical protein